MTARSVPDSRRWTAVEWRRVWGEMFRPARDGQASSAAATARLSRSRTPERVMAVPFLLGNIEVSGAVGILSSQDRSPVAVVAHSGMTRCLRPLP